MKFNIKHVNKSPVVWCDNFFTKEEIQNIKEECNRIRQVGILEDIPGAQKKINGKLKSLNKNKTVFLEEIYEAEPRLSYTLNVTKSKLFDEKFINYLTDLHPYFETMNLNQGTRTLLSYYTKSNYYEGHRDCAFVTVLTWFFEEPKSFEGGDFIIENDINLECKNGRTVFMPSYLLHEVTPIKMVEDKKGLGRYSLSHFVHCQPQRRK